MMWCAELNTAEDDNRFRCKSPARAREVDRAPSAGGGGGVWSPPSPRARQIAVFGKNSRKKTNASAKQNLFMKFFKEWV